MSLRNNPPWVPLEKIELFVQIEPALVILALAFCSWSISKLFLSELSKERKRNLNALFKNLVYHLIFGALLFSTYYGLQQLDSEGPILEKTMTYLGFCTILAGATVFIKAWRILVFEYFFLSHMKVAFPVLLVNLFTLLLSLALASWIGTEIFNIRLAPILATSAIFSLVLGLALQDTLGNLFAGVALQFDKPYGIGDWVEIQSNGQKWTGQVYEISWRATILIAFSEELITVPNRIMSQAEISNFSTPYRPIIRNQIFRLAFQSPIEEVKRILLQVAQSTPEIRRTPPPLVLISETTESWVSYKLIYYLDDYGIQYLIADKIYSRALDQLKAAGLELSGHRLVTQLTQLTQK